MFLLFCSLTVYNYYFKFIQLHVMIHYILIYFIIITNAGVLIYDEGLIISFNDNKNTINSEKEY